VERQESIGRDTIFMHKGGFISNPAASEMQKTSPHSIQEMHRLNNFSDIKKQESIVVSRAVNMINT